MSVALRAPWEGPSRWDWRTLWALAIVNGAALALLLAGLGPVVIAAAVLSIAGMLVLARPQRGVLLLVALAPFNGLLLVAPITGAAKAWKEALVILLVAATFVAPLKARAKDARAWPQWAPMLMALLAVATVSGVAMGGLLAVVGMKVVFFYTLLIVVIWRCPLDAVERDRLVTILMATGFITAIIGIGQQLVGHAALEALGYEYNFTIRFTGGFLRSFSTFNQPFGFGLFLMVVLLVGTPFALRDTARARNRAFLLVTPILGIALALTFVRSAWVGLAVGLAYLGLTRNRLLLLGIPAGAVALLVLLALPAAVSGPALSSSSSGQRVTGWQENASQLLTNPIGVGVGASGAASERLGFLRRQASFLFPEPAPAPVSTYQPDNFYFKMLFELGVVGLWLFVLFLAAVIGSTRSAERRHAGAADGDLAGGITAMVIAAAAACFVQTYFEIFPVDVLFWVLIAVAATMPTERLWHESP